MSNAIIAAAAAVTSIATVVLVVVTIRYVQLTSENVREMKEQHLRSINPLLVVYKFELFVRSRQLHLGIRNAGTGMAISSTGKVLEADGEGAHEPVGQASFGDLSVGRSLESDIELTRPRDSDNCVFVIELLVADIVGNTSRWTQRIVLQESSVQFEQPVKQPLKA